MVCLPQNMEDDFEEVIDNTDYVVRRKGGRSLIDKPPKFSPDETLLFVISGRGVQIYNAETTEFVRSLKDKKNSSPIIGMDFPPSDDRSLITCTEDGSIVSWKWHGGVQISQEKVKLLPRAHAISFDLLNDDEAVIGWGVDKSAFISVFNLKNQHLHLIPLPKMECGLQWTLSVGWYGDDRVVAVSDGSAFFHVFNVTREPKPITHQISAGLISSVTVTGLAWHPTQDLLAMADTLGRVILFTEPLSQRAARETCHWHHLPLPAIAFSTQGGVLVTGGAERVVVAWGSTTTKRFVPRLPAEILHIATSTGAFAVATADNGIQIINAATLYISGCIREAGGLGGARRHLGATTMSPGLQYVPPAEALMLPAGPGHLHLYSTASDSLMYTLDVTNTNIVPPERNNLHPEQIEVHHLAVGSGGQWAVSWEGRHEQERLRYWQWGTSGWTLHTVVARPHRPARPAALHMAADASVALSYDSDHVLRFWTIVDSIPGYEGKAAWCTTARGNTEGGVASGAALSADGSLAAAWAGARLALWDSTGLQNTCLAHPALRPRGRLVQFGRDHHMHYVACTTDSCLAVWSTMSLRLVWIVKLNTACLVADPFSDRVAAISEENDVFVFRMSSPHPLLSLPNALPAERGAVTSAAFAPAPRGSSDFRLYLLREQQEIFVVERSESAEGPTLGLESLNVSARPPPSAFSKLVAEQKVSLVSMKPGLTKTAVPATTALTELLLSSASHAQPSLRSVCGPVLRALAGARPPTYVPVTEAVLPTPDQPEDPDENVPRPASTKPLSLSRLLKENVDWASNIVEQVQL